MALVANYESDVGYAWWLMENFWALIAEQAQRQGRPCLLAYPRIGAVPDRIRKAPLDIREIRIARSGWRNAWKTAQFFRRHGVTSVYLTDWPYLHWCYLLWRLHGVRRIVMHDHAPGVRRPARGARACMKKLIFSLRAFSCDQYVAVSKYVSQRHLENACVPAHLDVVVENGIIPFDPRLTDRRSVRDRLGIPQDAILIVLVSRATYYKGIDLAIRAVAGLLQDLPDRLIYAVHCGDGPDLSEFRALATEMKIDREFRFLGRREDVRDILASADIALHPSKGEAMSLAILEFMCARLPVVVPDNPSVATSVEHEVSGLLYQAGNADATRQCLLRLCTDTALRARLAENARRICLERYELDTTNQTFLRRVVALL